MIFQLVVVFLKTNKTMTWTEAWFYLFFNNGGPPYSIAYWLAALTTQSTPQGSQTLNSKD